MLIIQSNILLMKVFEHFSNFFKLINIHVVSKKYGKTINENNKKIKKDNFYFVTLKKSSLNDFFFFHSE